MKQISLLIVDDQPVFLTGLHTVLHDHEDFVVLGEAKDGREAIEAVHQKKPDVVIMDISMPNLNGIDATREILKLSSGTKVLALSIHSGKRFVKEMLDAGAAGYLLKDSAPDELVRAIRKVIKGDMYLDSAIISTALDKDEIDEKPGNLNILRTKLHRPPVTNDIITRTRIIDQLESNIDKPFSLVSAPAGYGKSMAVSQWLEYTETLFTWLSLDEDHNDLRTFLLYLQAAIEKLFPGSLGKSASLLQSTVLPPLKVIFNAVINDLDRIEQDFILVLDDYHCIEKQEIHQLVTELLAYPPEHMHLAILTRVDPPLKINSLLAHGRMTELRMLDLSFTDTEIAELFLNLHKRTLEPATAQEFFEKTEGWIVGLRMAFMNIRKQEDVERMLADLQDEGHSLSIYLIHEVIAKQPEGVKELLLVTAVLDRFCKSLIDAVHPTEEESSKQYSGEEFVNWLIQSNLFIIALDDNREWFRYHHLIQELLKTRLREQKNTAEISHIHSQASQWFERHNFIEEAIQYRLSAGNPDEACNIVERHRMAELDNDRWYVVQRWLYMIPEELKPVSPELLLSDAWSAYQNFQLEKIPGLLDQVKSLLTDNKKDRALLGECYLIYGFVHQLSGNAEIALQEFQKANELLPDTRKLAMGMLHLHIALARCVSGKKELASKDLDKLYLSGRGNAIYLTRLVVGYYYINMFAGDLQEARKEAQRSQKLALGEDLQYSHAVSIVMEGIPCFHAFNLKDARDLFVQAEQQRYILHRAHAIDALASLVITYELLQQSSEADKTLVRLDQFARELNDPQYGLIASSCRARLSILRGDFSSAIEWEKTVEYDPGYAALFVWVEVPLLTKARVLVASGAPESLGKASELLNKFMIVSREYHLVNQTIEALVLNSMLLKKQGKIAEAMETLAEVVVLAEPGRWIRPFVEAGPVMTDMLKELRNNENYAYFIDQVLETILPAQTRSSTSAILKAGTSSTDNQITFREKEIIQLLAQGLRNKEIANKLFVAEGTVKKHIYNVYQKMDVNNRIAMLSIARESGLIEQA